MSTRRRCLSLLLALVLGACSAGDYGSGGQTLKGIGAAVRSATTGAHARATPARVEITRAMLAGVKGPLMLARVERIGGAATLGLRQDNAGYQTWVSPDAMSLTFRDGVLVASRGLPGDLLAVDSDATVAALRAGRGASYPRAWRFIGGEREVVTERLSCEMRVVGAEQVVVAESAHPTTHMAEVCTDGAGNTVRNDFWRGDGGIMWKSNQFLHPLVGYVTAERLLR